ncbi:hypothetical protein BDW66DRAFT_96243 [Aspergillus desertorum]
MHLSPLHCYTRIPSASSTGIVLVSRFTCQESGVGNLKNAVSMPGSFLTIRDYYVYLVHQSAKDHLCDANASAGIFPSGPSAIPQQNL